jgi:hypothetical protein
MPEQLSKNGKPDPTTCANASMGMAKVVQPHIQQTGPFRNGLPGPVEISAGPIWLVAGDDEVAFSGEPVDDREGWPI